MSNPTEKFICTLSQALDLHEQETGTYIEQINISRFSIMDATMMRAKKVINGIELRIS